MTSTGAAFCWGAGDAGQVGEDSTSTGNRTVPAEASIAGKSFSVISSGANHSYAVATTGSAYCWGSNDFGQLGYTTFTQRTAPSLVTGTTVWQSVASGNQHTCGLASSGAILC